LQQSFKIGTRGSPLALYQANLVRAELARAHSLPAEGEGSPFDIVVITTSGDRIQDRALIEAGGKGLFTKEIEDALFSGAIDCAVHSMKDVPTALPAGLEISAILEREDVRDAWISPKAPSIEELPEGARVGTSSLRRQAQVLARRPDLEVVVFRGNVDTRLAKLEDGQVDGTLLAAAGLKRLGRLEAATRLIPVTEMLPAVAQGAIGIEVREDDARAKAMVAPLNHGATDTAVRAERAFLAELDGSCRTPIAALAVHDSGGMLTLTGKVLSPDGKTIYDIRRSGPGAAPEVLGQSAGAELRKEAGETFFAEILNAGGS
jgi:hydroxymethylbilane synthase